MPSYEDYKKKVEEFSERAIQPSEVEYYKMLIFHRMMEEEKGKDATETAENISKRLERMSDSYEL